MSDNKTAAVRKQLKIKTGVVKRWVATDQMIQFPCSNLIKSSLHLRFLFVFLYTFLSSSPSHYIFSAFENLRGRRNPSPPHRDRAYFFLACCHVSCVQNTHRLSKEQKLYAQENQDQKLKVDRLVASNGDEWDIKNGVRSIHALSLLVRARNCRTGGPWFRLLISLNRTECWRNRRG